MSEEKFSGHVTLKDGTHKTLTSAEAEAMWNESNARQAERAKKLPDERTAIDAMFEAFDRLRELGWRDAIYCPKDGTNFEVIEAGSTGIHPCHYTGEWPKGSWWVEGDGDLWPSRPILFRLYPEDQAKVNERMQQARNNYRASQAPVPTSEGVGR